ncbi:hypothetical protein BGZ98_003189, partial [Dissophora globulifera]
CVEELLEAAGTYESCGNVVSAAKDSSRLQKAVGRHQLHQALMELQQEEQEEQEQEQEYEHEHEQHKQEEQAQQQKESEVFCAIGPFIPSDPSDDDFSHKSSTRTTLNFNFTKSFIEHCFGDDENDIKARLIQIDVPEAPRQEVDFIIKFAIATASKEYLDFKAMLRRSGLELNGLVGDILTAYTATNALWQDRTGLARNEDTYIKQSVMPTIDAVFGIFGPCSALLRKDEMTRRHVS